MVTVEYHLPSAARGTTSNIELSGQWQNCHTIVGALRVTAASGTTPTLDVTVQETVDGTNWDTILTFTRATAAANERKSASAFATSPTFWAGRRMRILWTVGGTTPSFTFTVDLYGRP